MNGTLSTYNLAVILIAAIPVRHYVIGHGRHASRVSTRYAPPIGATEYKTERIAKAQLTRRVNAKT